MDDLALRDMTTDAVERLATRAEAAVARLRAIQAAAVAELDRRQVPTGDGCRSLHEWVAGRLDVSADTAQRIVALSHCGDPALRRELADGSVTVDRALAEDRLMRSGADADARRRSREWDVEGVRRLAARHRRLHAVDERQAFAERFVAMQPSLDESRWHLWGRLAGVDGRIVFEALTARGDQLPDGPDGRGSAGQRRADALVAMSQDSIAGSDEAPAVVATVFVDAALAAATEGEAGAEVVGGPRVGPAVLEEILCSGRVEVNMAGAGPLAIGPSVRSIPPRLRRYVLARDGGSCTADGCRSRYRLQPHHVVTRANSGSHDPDNLTTLCWYHHHVVVHGRGFRIDPVSPPQRRRFLPPRDRSPPD